MYPMYIKCINIIQLSSCPAPRDLRLKDLIHGIEATARQALRHLHPGHGLTDWDEVVTSSGCEVPNGWQKGWSKEGGLWRSRDIL
jgi:hypothetical protein